MAPIGLAAVADQFERAAQVESPADRLVALRDALQASVDVGAVISVEGRRSITIVFSGGMALSLAPGAEVNFDVLVEVALDLARASDPTASVEEADLRRLAGTFNSGEITDVLDRGIDRDPDLLV